MDYLLLVAVAVSSVVAVAASVAVSVVSDAVLAAASVPVAVAPHLQSRRPSPCGTASGRILSPPERKLMMGEG